MSNTRKPTAKPFSLDRYRAEVKGEPFVLWVDDETKIEVQRPTGDQIFAAEEARTSKAGLRAMCGGQADELLDVLGTEDAAVMSAVLEDMRQHFGLGE